MKSNKTGLEELIKGLALRIKEIDESPGPKTMRADKLLVELAKGRLEAQLDAWKRGKPSIDGPGAFSGLFRAMGLEPTMYTVTAEYDVASFTEFKAIVERSGFPADKFCDKVVAQLAMGEIGEVPKADIIYADSHGCDNDHKYYSRTQGDRYNIPTFFVDIPLHEDDKPTLASLNYIADQLGDFIEWAEKTVPGVKYDEAKHIEILELDALAQKLQQEIYQLLRHVPCPISPRDVLARVFTQFTPSRYADMQKVIEYLTVIRDELGERVASGKGPYPEERLRVIWAGQVHFLQALDPCKLLLDRKVALPLSIRGDSIRFMGLRGAALYGEVSEYGIKLSPLQEMASLMSTSCWGGPGKRWSDGILKVARDIGANGIIHFLLVGCTPMRGMSSIVAERAEKELGIPTWNLEGRYMDRDYMSQKQFEEALSSFVDKCFDWAGKPRQ